MEVLLNTIWLLVAIAALLFWEFRAQKSPWHSKYYCRRRILALAVVLVFLFPVISLTDDLHAEQAAMEDSSRTVIKARNMVQGCLRAAGASFVPAVTRAADPAAGFYLCLGTVVPCVTTHRRFTPVSAHAGRSPPFPA
jgi:hypothetical protein